MPPVTLSAVRKTDAGACFPAIPGHSWATFFAKKGINLGKMPKLCYNNLLP